MTKKTTIPTILGIAAITIGVAAGVLLVEQRHYISSRAAEDSVPQNVRISNISDTEFTVSWSTPGLSVNAIKWGESSRQLHRIVSDTSSSYTHSLTVEGLEPSHTYFFTIVSGNTAYDANGIPWQVTTGPTLPQTKIAYTISGKVVNESGDPLENAIVYAIVGGASPLSTTTSASGNWVLSVGQVRSQDLLNYIKINPETTLVELNVLAEKSRPTSAKFYLSNASYGHTIVVGKANDFTSEELESIKLIPTAAIAIPASDSTTTGFGELLDSEN